MAVSKRTALLHRSSPRKRGPRGARTKELDSRLRGNEREELASPALYRLMAWLSPAYPVGAFSYSSGIEWAVEAGDIKDAETLTRLARRHARRRRGLLRRGAVRGGASRRHGGRRQGAARRGRTRRRAGAEQGAPSGNHRARQRLRRGDAGGLADAGARPAESGLGRPGRLSGGGGGCRGRPRHRACAPRSRLPAGARRQLGVAPACG